MEKRSKEFSELQRKTFAAKLKCDRIKRNGVKCGNLAMKGAKQCRLHGGRAASGARSGKFKTGKYSLVLPRDIAEKYEVHLADARLVELRTDIALTRTRRDQLLKMLKEGNSRSLSTLLSKILRDGKKQLSKGTTTPYVILEEIERQIQQDMDEYLKWDEINAQIDRTRKLVEAEARRLKDMNAVMTMEQAMAFIMAIANISKRFLPDEAVGDFLYEMGKTMKLASPSFALVETKPVVEQIIEDDAVEGELVED